MTASIIPRLREGEGTAINPWPTDGRPLVPILVPDDKSTSGQRIVLIAAKETEHDR